MTDRNRIDRSGLDDLALSRAERKALRDDANDSVTSDNGSWVPKPALASEIADREGTAEWAGDDEQVELPEPDQYSFGAGGGIQAQSGAVGSLIKFDVPDVVAEAPLDELEDNEFQAMPELDANASEPPPPQSLKEIFITSIKSPRDVASGQVTDAHDRFANQEVSYVQSDDGVEALLPFVEQDPLVMDHDFGGAPDLDGGLDL